MLLSEHNIRYYQDLMRGLREAIVRGELAAHSAHVRAVWQEGQGSAPLPEVGDPPGAAPLDRHT